MDEKNETTGASVRKKQKPRTGTLVFLCALALAVILAVCLTGRSDGLALPAGSSDDTAMEETSDYSMENADITPDNVQQVIASLRRPDAYTASVTNTLYWSGNWQTIGATAYVRDGVCVVAYQDTDGTVDHYIAVSGEQYYAWRSGDTTQYSAQAGSASADDMSMIPTYETVISADEDSITAAGERTVNGESCIYATVDDAETGYSLTYWVSTVSGLLIQADYTRDGELVRSVVLNDIRSDTPSESFFQLPDGSSLLSAEPDGQGE